MDQLSNLREIPDDITVNDLIRLFPEAVEVFNDFGIDACCGGAVPVRVATARDGADTKEVLAALMHVIREIS